MKIGIVGKSRYIDADEALRMMRNSQQDNPCESSYKGIWHTAHECCISCVDATPTADVVEVRHGEWIVVKEYNDYRMRYEAKIACSVCGHKPKYEGYLSDMEYCPKCGAKMDGQRSENGT